MPKTQAESNMDDPEQFAAWAFAAGIPDPRGGNYPNQPMVPAPCFGALSKMLWDMGFRHVAEEQKAWVKPASGPDRNFQAWGVTDVMPQAAAMLADQFPEKVEAIAKVTPETHAAALQEAAGKMLDSIARLKAASEQFNQDNKGGAAV